MANEAKEHIKAIVEIIIEEKYISTKSFLNNEIEALAKIIALIIEIEARLKND